MLLVSSFLLLVLILPASGQRRTDIGFMTAIPWYLGDLSSTVPQPNVVPPAIGPILRYSFNMRNCLRAHAVFYELSGSGNILGGEEVLFQSSFVDLGLDFEFNWWPYISGSSVSKFSPYVSAGLGYSLNYTGGSVSHLYLPFGGGVKVNLGKRMSGGVEINMRKSFSDLVDGVENLGGDDVQTMIGNNDWYFFTGLFLTYKIFNFRDVCPAYE